MNRRAQTNQLLYQSRLMLDQARSATDKALMEACEEAAVGFMHRALRSALAEAGEAYGQSLAPDRPLHELLRQLGEQRPDGWEYRSVKEALAQPDHWMCQLHQAAEHWSGRVGQASVRTMPDQLIELVHDEADSRTNHYRNWLADLQQWVESLRELSDFS